MWRRLRLAQHKLGIADSALFTVAALGVAVPALFVRGDGGFGKRIILLGDPVRAEDGQHDRQVDEAVEHAHEHRQEEHLEEDDEDHGLREAEETAFSELDVSQSGADQNMNRAMVTWSSTLR